MTTKRDLIGVSTRRAFFLGGLGAIGFGAIGARLVYLQTLDPSDYQEKAEENQFDTWFVPPPRGVVYDRFGERLAITSRDYRVLITPEQAEDIDLAITKIGALLAMPPEAVARKIREVKAARKFDAVLVRQGLTWDQFAAVNVRLPELPGVRAEAGEQRFYPYMSAFAHPIGYVQKPGERDIETIIARERERAGIPKDVPIDPPEARFLRHPDARVGKTGLEARLEPLLKGEPGLKKVEVNAAGRVVSEIGREERRPNPGGSVVLTLDAEIQRIAMERMGGESAACVIMDAQTGELLVMASAPGYDPNAFVNGISATEFKRLNSPELVGGPEGEERDLKRLYHKAVKGAYKPGSTFKIVTGLAALAAGLPDNFRVNCPGSFAYGGRLFHCWKRGGHGTVDLRAAIKGSCNVFFYQAALRAEADGIAKAARQLGFGAAFDIDLPMGEMEDGIVPDPAWFQRVRKAPWPNGNTLNIGIGQGDLLVTPLQLAVMTARVASGKAVEPRLVRESPGRPPPKPAQALPFDPTHLARVTDGMVAVCEPGGTAFASAGQLRLARDKNGRIVPAEEAGPGAPPVRMAGKTGTAQVRVITAAERARGVKRNEDLPWRLRDHALFVFYAPLDEPRYAGAVIVEHGMGGSRIAAPIAADVMRSLLLRDPANRKPITLSALSNPGRSA